MRRPYRERFAIILNEFGAGLAGRGKDLRKAIRGADPALRELDKVLAILARQNRLLAEGAKSGDRVLAEWAKERKAVSNAIVKGNIAAQATAERARGPRAQLRAVPEVHQGAEADDGGARRDGRADAAGRARDLNAVGPEVSRILQALGPFSRNGIAALNSLGDTADVGQPRTRRSRGPRSSCSATSPATRAACPRTSRSCSPACATRTASSA